MSGFFRRHRNIFRAKNGSVAPTPYKNCRVRSIRIAHFLILAPFNESNVGDPVGAFCQICNNYTVPQRNWIVQSDVLCGCWTENVVRSCIYFIPLTTVLRRIEHLPSCHCGQSVSRATRVSVRVVQLLQLYLSSWPRPVFRTRDLKPLVGTLFR